jgi:hypothetical protein
MASRKLHRALLPAAALLAGSALAVSAADGQTGQTLNFNGSAPTARDVKQVDVRPHGRPSTGDQIIGAVALRQDGRLAGRLHLICTILDRSYEGQDCQFVLVLRDGTITASGGGLDRLLPGQRPSPPHSPDEYAITGGTGTYHGASGTMSMQAHRDDSSAITLSL